MTLSSLNLLQSNKQSDITCLPAGRNPYSSFYSFLQESKGVLLPFRGFFALSFFLCWDSIWYKYSTTVYDNNPFLFSESRNKNSKNQSKDFFNHRIKYISQRTIITANLFIDNCRSGQRIQFTGLTNIQLLLNQKFYRFSFIIRPPYFAAFRQVDFQVIF